MCLAVEGEDREVDIMACRRGYEDKGEAKLERERGRGGEEDWGERRRLPTVACGVLDVGMNRDPGGERVRVVTVESQSQRRGDWAV